MLVLVGVGVVLRIHDAVLCLSRCAHTDEMPLGNGADVGFSTDGAVRVELRDPLPGQQVVGGDAKRSAELEQTLYRRSGLVEFVARNVLGGDLDLIDEILLSEIERVARLADVAADLHGRRPSPLLVRDLSSVSSPSVFTASSTTCIGTLLPSRPSSGMAFWGHGGNARELRLAESHGGSRWWQQHSKVPGLRSTTSLLLEPEAIPARLSRPPS